MNYRNLLGSHLKSDELCDLFETYDVQVVYAYDRNHEGLQDAYHAEIPDLGLQFVFDDNQLVRTLFVKPAEAGAGYNPFAQGEDKPALFPTKADALRHAITTTTAYTEGVADFLGEGRDWIRLEYDTHSVHYEYTKERLRMITLQATPTSSVTPRRDEGA